MQYSDDIIEYGAVWCSVSGAYRVVNADLYYYHACACIAMYVHAQIHVYGAPLQ